MPKILITTTAKQYALKQGFSIESARRALRKLNATETVVKRKAGGWTHKVIIYGYEEEGPNTETEDI
jgi:hypothetical protein